MGGYNSGRWHWHTRKTTVEECYMIGVKDFAKTTLARCFEANEPVYYGESGPAGLSALLVDRVLDELFEKKGQSRPEKKPHDRQTGQAFRITRTACNYGGHRYWLLCPDCERRCGKLYKPTYAWRYACRECHDLSYTSAQEAHKYDRLKSFGTLARNIDLLTRAEQVLKKIDKCRGGSKNFWRLVARYEKIMAAVRPTH